MQWLPVAGVSQCPPPRGQGAGGFDCSDCLGQELHTVLAWGRSAWVRRLGEECVG